MMTVGRLILYFAILVGALIWTSATARPQETEVIAGGELEYQNHCAICHGIDGIGKNPDVPNLAGEGQQYIQKQLKAFRSGGRQHEQMSIIAKDLTDDDIKNLADWFSSLKVTVKLP